MCVCIYVRISKAYQRKTAEWTKKTNIQYICI